MSNNQFGELGSVHQTSIPRAKKAYAQLKAAGFKYKDLDGPLTGLRPGSIIAIPITYYGGLFLHFGLVNTGKGAKAIIDLGGHGDGRISVQYSTPPEFSYGDPANIKYTYQPRTKQQSEDIIKRAKCWIGFDNYSLLNSGGDGSMNCEGWANLVVFGQQFSGQTNAFATYVLNRINA
jgi:hypothetical protein